MKIHTAFAQDYQAYLSDQPNQHGLPDGLTEEQYYALQEAALGSHGAVKHDWQVSTSRIREILRSLDDLAYRTTVHRGSVINLTAYGEGGTVEVRAESDGTDGWLLTFNPKESERTASHGCGMCNAPLKFDGAIEGTDTWRCAKCDWWHTSAGCCEAVTS